MMYNTKNERKEREHEERLSAANNKQKRRRKRMSGSFDRTPLIIAIDFDGDVRSIRRTPVLELYTAPSKSWKRQGKRRHQWKPKPGFVLD